MRQYLVAATFIVLFAAVSPAIAQAQSADPPPARAEDTPQTTPQSPSGTQQQILPPQAQEKLPSDAPASAQRPEPPTGQSLGSAQQDRDGKAATQSRSGIGGKQEPSASSPKISEGPVLMDGRLNVPGAPQDGQTVPSKFSERNAALDKLTLDEWPASQPH